MTERDHLTNCGIYKITSPTNKIYIGQSVNIRKRWGYYRQPHATSLKTILGRSLAKYGWRSHVFEVLIECPPEHLNEMEIKYIEMFKTFNTRHGMNAKGGGESGRMSESAKQKLSVPKSEETKQKFSIAARNRPPITEETRKKHSEARKGRKCKPSTIELKRIISTGKFHTEETKQKISRTKTGVKFSEETKKRLRGKRGRPVIQLSLDAVFIKEFPSGAIAGFELGCSGSDVIQCCLGKRNKVKTFTFRYKYPIKNDPRNVK